MFVYRCVHTYCVHIHMHGVCVIWVLMCVSCHQNSPSFSTLRFILSLSCAGICFHSDDLREIEALSTSAADVATYVYPSPSSCTVCVANLTHHSRDRSTPCGPRDSSLAASSVYQLLYQTERRVQRTGSPIDMHIITILTTQTKHVYYTHQKMCK